MADEGWTTMPFDQCAELVRDTVHPSEVSGCPYIGLEHISEGQLSLSGYGSSDQVTSNKSRFQKGDILFGKLRPYFRKVVIGPFDGICSTDIWVVRHKRGIDQRYLFYWMASHEFIEESTRASEGTKMPRAQWEFVGRITKPIPPLRGQQAIACILGALDDKIGLNRRMNRTLEETARAIFKSWFVDFDPVRAKAAGMQPPGLKPEIAALFPDTFEDSALGDIPKGWTVKAFSELTSLITKGTTPTQGDVNSAPETDVKINYVRVNCIEEDGSLLANQLTLIPESVHAGVLNRSILKCGDILYTIAGTIGRIALAEDWILPANTNQAVAIIRPSPSMPSGFLMLTMRQEAFRQELHNNIVHAVQANLSLGMLSKAQAVVPPLPTLPRIFAPVNAIQSRIIGNRTQSRTLAALRDTLLAKLISGELPVPDAERIAGRAV